MSEEVNATTGDPMGPGGQGGDDGGNPTGWAGFETPEALADAYTGLSQKHESLQKQISDLERIKGSQGSELGTLRQQMAQLTGQLEAYKNMPRQEPQGPTLDDIAAKLQAGEIDEATALKTAQHITQQSVATKLGAEFKQMLQKEIGAIKNQYAQEKYVQQFLKENPGYEEAYNSGKLQSWLDRGISGEQAWLHYQLQATKTELDGLQQQAAQAAKQAQEAGFKNGAEAEKAKTAAGKVLTGKGGQFTQAGGKFDLSDPSQRRMAGIERLKQMRAG